MKKGNGFTLVEILVVIAIIAVLASIVLANLSSGQTKSRDARRLADLKALAGAVQLYFVANDNLPRTTAWCTYISNPTSNWGPDFQADIQPFLPSTPRDPKYGGQTGDYFYKNNNDTTGVFTVCAVMENLSTALPSSYTMTGCTGWSASYNYCIDYH